MRILVITEYYSSSFRNGSEVFAHLLIRELCKYHDMTLLARATDDIDPGLHIAVPDHIYNTVDGLKHFLITNVNPYDFDIIYNLGGLHFGCFIVKYLREQLPGLTIVNHFQLLFAPYGGIEKMSVAKQNLLSKPQVEAASGAALNIFISINELCSAFNHGFKLSSPVAVISNGIEINDLEMNRVSSTFQIPLINGRKPIVFLTSGRFSEYIKGADIVFRAFRRLLCDKKDVYLIAIGPTEKYEFLLKDVAKENYHLLEWQTREDLANLFSIADVMLVPSRYEPFGMIAVEGMAAGLPVIANDTGGLSEIVNHQKNGLLNRNGNGWLGFYKCMHEIASAPEKLSAMSQQARQTAVEKYNIIDIGTEVDKHLRRATISHKVLEPGYTDKQIMINEC